jgi:hypothetical protein
MTRPTIDAVEPEFAQVVAEGHAHKLSWDEAEQTLCDGLARALLNPNCAT